MIHIFDFSFRYKIVEKMGLKRDASDSETKIKIPSSRKTKNQVENMTRRTARNNDLTDSTIKFHGYVLSQEK